MQCVLALALSRLAAEASMKFGYDLWIPLAWLALGRLAAIHVVLELGPDPWPWALAGLPKRVSKRGLLKEGSQRGSQRELISFHGGRSSKEP